jgi:hypothetical protein
VGLERGPFSLVSTIEELLGRKCSGSGLEIREYGRRDPSRWPLGIFYLQKLGLTSLTSGSRSVGIVRSRTQAIGFNFSFLLMKLWKWSLGLTSRFVVTVSFRLVVMFVVKWSSREWVDRGGPVHCSLTWRDSLKRVLVDVCQHFCFRSTELEVVIPLCSTYHSRRRHSCPLSSSDSKIVTQDIHRMNVKS